MIYRDIKKYKYELMDDFTIQVPIKDSPFKASYFNLTKEGILTIKLGYKWDGVSGPTWDSDNTMIGGLVHDCLYQCIRCEFLAESAKEVVDDTFYDILISCGMSKFRAGYYYRAVDVFGASSCIAGDTKSPKFKEIDCELG